MQCPHNPCFAFGALSDPMFMCKCIPFSGYVNWVTTSTTAQHSYSHEARRVHTGRIYVKWNGVMYSFLLFCIFPISFWLLFYYILLLLLWSKWLTGAMLHTCRRVTMKNMHMNASLLSTIDKGLHIAGESNTMCIPLVFCRRSFDANSERTIRCLSFSLIRIFILSFFCMVKNKLKCVRELCCVGERMRYCSHHCEHQQWKKSGKMRWMNETWNSKQELVFMVSLKFYI